MDNLKAVSILKTFSKKELLSFEKMLLSPYFECKQFTVKIFYELKKHYPDFSRLDKKTIFENAFPGKAYSDVLLRKSLSLLAEYAQRYIKLQLFEVEPEIADYGLVNYARRFKLFTLCGRKLKEFDKAQEKTEIHFDYFLYRYILEREKVFYNLAAFSQKHACASVVERNELLLLDFILKFSMGMYEMEANRSGFNYNYSGSPAYAFYKNLHFEKFLQSVEAGNEKRYLYEITAYMLKMTFTPDDEAFNKLKEAVMTNYNKFHYNLVFAFFSVLTAYSANKSPRENFELNKFMVENNFFTSYGGYFQLKDFIRAYKAALSAGETEWAEKFFKDNIKYLNPEHKENTELYCNAITNYHKKEFEKSLEFLSKVKYQLFSYKQDINVMALELHYELGNFEASFSMIDSYKHFLRENKFVEETARDRYNTFITFYTRLLNVRLKTEKIFKKGFKKELESQSTLAGKLWLLEKLEELQD